MRFRQALTIVAFSACLAGLGKAAAIDQMAIFTPDNGGIWMTGAFAAIGISDPGGTGNPFYNDPGTGAILPPGISSGTYLAFLGYESYWPTTTAILSLHYDDGSIRSAAFQVGDIHAAGAWTLLTGDPGLSLGGGGFSVTPDRVGTSGGPNIVPTDGIPDVVLQFSDVGDAPEPGTFILLGAGLLAMVAIHRKASSHIRLHKDFRR